MTPAFTSADWRDIDLVAFDVDGTLYSQRSLRVRMARDMAIDALAKHDLSAIRVIRAYRSIRERLADEEIVDFDHVLTAEVAKSASTTPERVRAVASEWMEARPLRYLRACVYEGVPQLFEGLQRAGKKIGVFSDYPAKEKLAAMELPVDHVVSAGEVGLLKPHAKGLQYLMNLAGTTARATLFIGDRADRDGLAGQRAGVRVLIRSAKPMEGFQTFKTFRDPLFAPFMS